MLHPWVTTWGEEIDPSLLAAEPAIRLRDYVARHGAGVAVVLGARRRNDGFELVVLDFQTGRPQRPVYAIQRVEPIGVIFPIADAPPTVLSLRHDFPDTPHQNMVPDDVPCCLCVDDRPWQEAKATYTSSELVFRIVRWFERAGVGQLHDLAQPLDPFFGGQEFDIVLPATTFSATPSQGIELLGFVPSGDDPRVLIAVPTSSFRGKRPATGGIVFVSHSLPAASMSRLRKAPTNLLSLAQALSSRGVDIIRDLIDRMRSWATDEGDREFRYNARLGILVQMPIIHPVTGAVAGSNTVAFLTEAPIGEVGAALGRLSKNSTGEGGKASYVHLLQPGKCADAAIAAIRITMASVQLEFDRDRAATLAGRTNGDPRRIVLIGAGAVGSILSEQLVREGRFCWTVADDDVFLPHNLARHSLTLLDIGRRKAEALVARLNAIRWDAAATAISANFLRPEEDADKVASAIAQSELVLDVSASVAVSRHLCDVAGSTRCASAFFNPAGTAAVLMLEDHHRTIDLRSIEAAYYRAILQGPPLDEHLSQSTDRIPYAGACRALTNRIPSSRANTLAGLLAMGLGVASESHGAILKVWSLHDDGAVSIHTGALQPPTVHRCGDWTIHIAEELGMKIAAMRRAKLNNETGGVLLGVVDIPAMRIDLVDAWPEPADSVGNPSEFVRGTGGLEDAVMSAIGKTLDQIRYVGEWHSHPRLHSTSPSTIDFSQIAWLAATLSADGCPGVMIIAGDDGLSVTLGEMRSP
jgi:hypothetical protein